MALLKIYSKEVVTIMEHHVVIVDCNHMLHTFYNGMQNRLSYRVPIGNGQFEEKDTTIHNGMIKNIFKWSMAGHLPTALCFDRPCISRKAFFQESIKGMVIGSGKEYKGNREKMPDEMFSASRDVYEVLKSVGASCYAVDGYEADDIIFACIKRAKEKYPGMHIDVITNDADLLPLVSDEVSVYLRSKRGTFAEDKTYEKTHYIEFTPRNYQEEVERLSSYNKFIMPYNSILLHKLLRGDSSDQFGLKEISKMFPPTKWNSMMTQMMADQVNFKEVFRYGEPQVKIMNRVTGEEFQGTMEEALKSPEKANLYRKVCNPEELDAIIDLLKEYSDLSDEQLRLVEKVYWGMNLNMVYPNKDKRLSRIPLVIPDGGKPGVPDIGTFSETELRVVANRLFGINLK